MTPRLTPRVSVWLPIALTAVGIGLLTAPPAAQAGTLMLEVLQAGFNDQLFIDNASTVQGSDADRDATPDPAKDTILGDANPNAGILGIGSTTAVIVNGLSVTGSLASSNSPGGSNTFSDGSPIPGPAGSAVLATGSTRVSNPTGSTIVQNILIGDTGYTTPLSGTMLSTFAGTLTNGTIRVRTWDDPLNRQFGGSIDNPGGAGLILGMDQTFTAGAIPLSFSFNSPGIPFSFTSAYSKTIEFDLTLLAGGVLQGRSDVIVNAPSVVPEPASLVMMGMGVMGVFGIGLARARKARRMAA